MIVYQILMSIIILVFIPSCMGMTLICDRRERSVPMALGYGYMIMMVSFELVTVPVLLFTRYQNFRYVLWIYTPIMFAISAFGIYRAYKTGFLKQLQDTIPVIWEELRDRERFTVWMIAALIMVLMLVLVSVRVIFDGDDAYYVTQSLIAQQKGAMYSSNPYTGGAAPIDMRHALAVFTMWISYVGSITRIHTTILCHSVLPLAFIPLAVTVYAQTGALLLGDKRKDLLPYFCVFTELFILFGRVSMYTPETFLLARTWQGKSVAANILLPMLILTLLLLADDMGHGAWRLLVLVNAAAGIFSSLAVVLVCIVTAAGGIVLAVINKKIKIFMVSCLCCVPGFIYMLLYVYYTYFGWR